MRTGRVQSSREHGLRASHAPLLVGRWLKASHGRQVPERCVCWGSIS